MSCSDDGGLSRLSATGRINSPGSVQMENKKSFFFLSLSCVFSLTCAEDECCMSGVCVCARVRVCACANVLLLHLNQCFPCVQDQVDSVLMGVEKSLIQQGQKTTPLVGADAICHRKDQYQQRRNCNQERLCF